MDGKKLDATLAHSRLLGKNVDDDDEEDSPYSSVIESSPPPLIIDSFFPHRSLLHSADLVVHRISLVAEHISNVSMII
jgi:hypothetical protein